MKTTLISNEENKAKFTLEFTAEEFEDAVIEAYKESKHQFNIDGFRKGKAPRSIIERHYGEDIFFEDAINILFRKHYQDALKEHELEVIDSPTADFGEVAKGKDLTITLDVPVYPTVEVKDYFGVEVEEREIEVSEDDIDVQIEMLQKRNARMVTADREVQNGDTVILDYAGFVGDEQFEGGTAESQQLVIGSGQFIPGFEEQLIGAKAGDDVDVKVTFPEEYHAENLAGKDAVFHCKVHEVKFEELPELDDEFVKDVSEFDTMEELRNDTRERLQESREYMVKNETKDALVDKITENNPVDVPASMVEAEVDQIMREMEQQMMYQGMSMDMYMQFMGNNLDDFRNDLRPDAEKRVASRIVLRSIADKENIQITDEDLEKEFARMAEVYQMEKDQVKEIFAGDNLEFFKKDIIITKIIDEIYNKAKIKKVKPAKRTEKKDEE